MTHKITAVQPGETWTGRDGGTNYDLQVTLDDGRSATVTAKTPDRWKAGDEVTIKSERPGRYGMKWSLDKADYANNQPGSQPRRSAKNDTPQIEAAWAIQTAVACLDSQELDTITAKARELLTLKYQLAKEIEETQNNNDATPF